MTLIKSNFHRIKLVLVFFGASLGTLAQEKTKIFESVPTKHSGLEFQNTVEETLEFNYYGFMHMYMGSGVAVGDFDNDGLPDVYFTSNNGNNKLYRNKGNLQFEDITEHSGTGGDGGFYTGVSTVDINNDGWLDIYVSCSGPKTRYFQRNLLYVNQKDGTFKESSTAYGIDAFRDHSIQSNFFDYDNDGDLDLYLLNTPVDFSLTNRIAYTPTEEVYNDPSYRAYGGADKLYRNNGNGTFTDVSEQAGIYPDVFFGLACVVSDFNSDGLPDIFVSNDFAGPDFLYINNGNGTFSESAKDSFLHISNYSMGADAADINNDGHQDLYVLDMLPKDYKRSRISMGMVPRQLMYKMEQNGYHRQYMHNVLQVNNAMGQEKPLFKELGYFSGLEGTDWSWSCLIADFDLDGHKDVHVTNGILRDVTNKDAMVAQKKYHRELKEKGGGGLDALKKSRALFPSVKLHNYLFRNNGDLTFEDVSHGNVGPESFSNGSAYADFDNDGDLDLVCNNVNDAAFLFKNISADQGKKFLKITFKGPFNNPFAIGARVEIHADDKPQYAEIRGARGYFSSSEPIIHFGLGNSRKVKKLKVIWPDGSVQVLKNIKANQTLTLDFAKAKSGREPRVGKPTLFEDSSRLLAVPHRHEDTAYDDFEDQILLPYKLSDNGPCLSKGDFNGDGYEDFFVGGGNGYAGAIYLQNQDGTFKKTKQLSLEVDRASEDMAAAVFDADGDGHLDLYVVSGSYEKDTGSTDLIDRLYINLGDGQMISSGQVPQKPHYGTSVTSIDFDGDGDLDVFIGGGVEKAKYPFATNSRLLSNNGKGKFTEIAGVLPNNGVLGMVTDAKTMDFDNDGDHDLVVVGEWMPITVLANQEGKFVDITDKMGLSHSKGWWNTIAIKDLDNDGRLDFVAGNLGTNYKIHASKEKPFHLYGNDLDGTGSVDIVLAKNIDGMLFPARGKMCSTEQMPSLEEKFQSFSEFAEANIGQIYGEKQIDEALHLTVEELHSSVVWNKKDHFKIEHLPNEAQYSVVNGLSFGDFDADGHIDIALAGNLYEAEVETSRADAGTGLILKGNGKGGFHSMAANESGFFAPGNIKSLLGLKSAKGNELLIVGGNTEQLQFFEGNQNVFMKK